MSGAPVGIEAHSHRLVAYWWHGTLVIAGQRVHVGISHAGRTVSVDETGATFRIHDLDHVLADVPRTTTKNITRFKARKPEPPRRRLPLGEPHD